MADVKSKFGGVPVEEDQPQSKFGGVYAGGGGRGGGARGQTGNDASSLEATSPMGRAVQGFAGAVNPIPAIRSLVTDPVNTVKSLGNAQLDQFKKAKEDFGQGHYSEAVGHGLAGALPLVGPAAANAGEQIGSGDVAGGVGNGLGQIFNIAAMPAVTKGAGRLVQLPAEPLAESALGIRGQARAYGANPGRAILTETTGIRPASIEQSARGVLKDIEAQSQAVANKNQNVPVSLAPPRDILGNKAIKAAAANSADTPKELSPMQSQLTEVRPGFAGATEYPPGSVQPISITRPPTPYGHSPAPATVTPIGSAPEPVVAENQNPANYLAMKRQFDRDFIGNWSPSANTKGSLGTARQVYGSMADTLHKAVPELVPLDKRASSLIPVAERARLSDLNAGPIETGINRLTRPTGGMIPMLFGLREGGPLGALGMMAAQESLGQPSVKMLGARGLQGLGNIVRSPISQKASQVAPFVKTKDQ